MLLLLLPLLPLLPPLLLLLPLLLLPLLLLLPFLPSWIKTLRAIGLRWFRCKATKEQSRFSLQY